MKFFNYKLFPILPEQVEVLLEVEEEEVEANLLVVKVEVLILVAHQVKDIQEHHLVQQEQDLKDQLLLLQDLKQMHQNQQEDQVVASQDNQDQLVVVAVGIMILNRDILTEQ